MVTIEPQVFYGGLGAILMAIAFGLRQWAVSWAYSSNARTDVYTLQEKSQAAITSAVVDAVKQGNVFQQKMIEVVEQNTRANEKSAAETRGMISMLDGFGTVLKNAIIGWDEAQGQIPAIRENAAQIPAIGENIQAIRKVADTLETNLEGSLNDQFGPVVTALTGIGKQLGELVIEVKTKDGEINGRLTTLIETFQAAEKNLLKTLEPIVLAHMSAIAKDPKTIVEETPTS
jgi:hypothetical protein